MATTIDGVYAPLGAVQRTSQAAEQKPTVATGKGLLYALQITNSNAAARAAFVFDNTSDSGTVLAVIALPIGTTVIWPLSYALAFGTGCTVACSSTLATYTASGSDLWITSLTKV